MKKKKKRATRITKPEHDLRAKASTGSTRYREEKKGNLETSSQEKCVGKSAARGAGDSRHENSRKHAKKTDKFRFRHHNQRGTNREGFQRRKRLKNQRLRRIIHSN